MPYIKYRTRDTQRDYGFWIVPQPNGEHRIYIWEQHGYGGRDTGNHATHRLQDNIGAYICWNGSIRTYESALAVAARWADATERYIQTGTRF